MTELVKQPELKKTLKQKDNILKEDGKSSFCVLPLWAQSNEMLNDEVSDFNEADIFENVHEEDMKQVNYTLLITLNPI